MTPFEKDREKLSSLGIRYSETFMEIVNEEDPGNDADRLWKWMAQLINDAYQVGVHSACNVNRDPE